MLTLAEMYKKFSVIYPANASEEQKLDMRTAFYSGAASVLELQDVLIQMGITNDSAVRHTQTWLQEIQDTTNEAIAVAHAREHKQKNQSH